MKSFQPATSSSMNEALRAVIKRSQYPLEIMLTYVGSVAINPGSQDELMKSSQPATTSCMSDQLRQVIKRRHNPLEIMLTSVRW